LLTLLAAVAVVTLAEVAATYRIARREIDAVLDYQLRLVALSLRDQALGLGRISSLGGAGERELVVQIWDRTGTRIYASTPAQDLPELPDHPGLATVTTETGTWTNYAVSLGGQVLLVSQPESMRSRLAFAAAARTLIPLLLLLPVLAILVWTIVGRVLSPIDRLARQVAGRSPSALQSLPEEEVPEEVRPLVLSLNALMTRLSSALAAQRAFVADAAHELRTPLAALKLQAQLASRARDEADRTAALADLQVGLERAAHVVHQLLTLAREEPGAEVDLPEQPVVLSELVGQVIADHARLAETKGIDLGATASGEDAQVHGNPGALRTLLANLVDNAIRYTPQGGRVDVAAGARNGTSFLEVADSGPGIPTADRPRVFDRFYRRSGTGESGSGLGLAIVKAIAERHGGRVTLGDSAMGGLSIRVELPGIAVLATRLASSPPSPGPVPPEPR
jgi:two-component system OmpR family sensor kinase